jgi:hypothetical protein
MISTGQNLPAGSGDCFPEPIAPESTSHVSQSKFQAEVSSTFQEIVFNGAVDTTTTHRRGRTGPQTSDSRTRTKSVKDAGGACWRCKFVGKAVSYDLLTSFTRLILSSVMVKIHARAVHKRPPLGRLLDADEECCPMCFLK